MENRKKALSLVMLLIVLLSIGSDTNASVKETYITLDTFQLYKIEDIYLHKGDQLDLQITNTDISSKLNFKLLDVQKNKLLDLDLGPCNSVLNIHHIVENTGVYRVMLCGIYGWGGSTGKLSLSINTP